ncbi:hypothetical protein [Streptomyces rapamycinicus]|uniref:Uncharacterized protein n=1 Tax=Streptomyces rapamycinicus TaxID=1226757 RepID=A0ABR6LYZ2_9ACTN|nr:hypothetical protein [Streptomyces rapamycinicus]MBB4787530.1 hypothetical protein [Streptomyces rapamycinicus]UTP36766.1 hypothetical protein LIV37_50560 [Streptomyces rapamycinicus NRRL 5491]
MPDPDTGELIFDAQVAEIPAYTGFTGRKKSEQVTARLIVRRVRDLAKPATAGEQGELFPVWRYHPFFTDNPAQTLQAEREHRHLARPPRPCPCQDRPLRPAPDAAPTAATALAARLDTTVRHRPRAPEAARRH